VNVLAEYFDEVLVVSLEHNSGAPVNRAADLPSGAHLVRIESANRGGRSITRRRLARLGQMTGVCSLPWEREVINTLSAWSPELVAIPTQSFWSAFAPIVRRFPSVLLAEEPHAPDPEVADPTGVQAAVAAIEGHLDRIRFRRAGCVVVISDAYVDWAQRAFPAAEVRVVPLNLEPLYEEPGFGPSDVPMDPNGVFVIGNMGNPRTAHGLADVVHELVAITSGLDRPALRLLVASADEPHRVLVGLPRDVVHFVGRVEDPRPYYRAAAATLVPAFVLSGVKTTVVQGWAMGCPVVTTQPAADALSAVSGRDLLAASSPRGVAQQLLDVVEDRALAARVARGGMRRFALLHRTDAVRAAMSSVIHEALRRTPGRPVRRR
jgi:glycosyltransferase involved in cell wall biosynthesis